MSMMASHAGDYDTPPVRAERSPSTFTARDLLIAAFYHIRIIILAALIPICVGIAAFTLTKTEYTAASLLMVIISREVPNSQNVTGNGPTTLSIEGLKQVESEVKILESADVINSTIEKVGRDRLFPAGPFSKVRDYFASTTSVSDRDLERFRRNLRAVVLDGSNVVEVSYTDQNRSVAIEATDALVSIYMARRRIILENPTARILMVEVERFKRDLSTVDNDIQALKGRVGIIDFTQDAVLAANQVDTVVQRRRQVAERRVAVAGQLAEAEKQMKALPETVFDFNQRSDSAGNDNDNNVLTQLLIERDRLAAQYSAGGSMMREINRKIETARRQIGTRDERLYQTNRDVRNPAIGYVNNMILSLRIEADALGQQEKELELQQANAEKRLVTLRSAETSLVELNRRRDTLSEGYREYLRRATAASIEESAAEERESNVRLIQDAGTAVTSRSMGVPFLGAGILGGLLFGAAAGAIASALRTSFILPTEAERVLELPMLGEIGNQFRAQQPNALDMEVGALTSLLLDTQVDGRPVRSMQFIAPKRDDEISAFTRRVAEEIAVQRGMRTLLVDLTPSAPNVGDDTSMNRLKGGLEVAPTQTPLLWVIADPANSPLLNVRLPMAEAHRLMDELNTEFDAVVFHTSAQGGSPPNQRINQLVDGNVLMIRAEDTRKLTAQSLRAAVIESGGVPLGFVFVGRRYHLPEWIYSRA